MFVQGGCIHFVGALCCQNCLSPNCTKLPVDKEQIGEMVFTWIKRPVQPLISKQKSSSELVDVIA
jgi:hypothetical protein